jgi:hypothetical protein
MAGTRDDLLAAAAALASQARKAAAFRPATVDGGEPWLDTQAASGFAAAAKVALEAAALAENTTAGEIDQVLGHLHAELADVDLLAESLTLEPVEFLRAVLGALRDGRGQSERAHQLAGAYSHLRNTLTRLEDDFTAADSEVSRRLATRIHMALATADQSINHAAMPPTTRSES